MPMQRFLRAPARANPLWRRKVNAWRTMQRGHLSPIGSQSVDRTGNGFCRFRMEPWLTVSGGNLIGRRRSFGAHAAPIALSPWSGFGGADRPLLRSGNLERHRHGRSPTPRVGFGRRRTTPRRSRQAARDPIGSSHRQWEIQNHRTRVRPDSYARAEAAFFRGASPNGPRVNATCCPHHTGPAVD